MTAYVVPAPELLINSINYSAAIDVWSTSCMFMELINHTLLFPVRNNNGPRFIHEAPAIVPLMSFQG
jgi:hypothetical protein